MGLALVAGTGWLYLLRTAGWLAFGPDVSGALPLQQLASGDAQPLPRLVAAWVPAGVLVGLALRRSRVGAAKRAAAVVLVAAGGLVLVGAVSDAATISGPIPGHLAPQASRLGTWIPAGLMAVGAVALWRRPPEAPAVPSGR